MDAHPAELSNLIDNSTCKHIRLKQKNKQLFLKPLFLKTDEAGRFFFVVFFSKKQMRPLFLFYILSKPNEAPFFVHFKHKNVDILNLTSE